MVAQIQMVAEAIACRSQAQSTSQNCVVWLVGSMLGSFHRWTALLMLSGWILMQASCNHRMGKRHVQIQQEFKSKYAEKAKTASANSFDRSFSPRLKYHMEYCMNNPGEISKIHRVKAKVDEVKGIMVQNIERVRFQPPLHSIHATVACVNKFCVRFLVTAALCSRSSSTAKQAHR